MLILTLYCCNAVLLQIIEDLQTRETNEQDSVHVINIDIQDNHEEATIGALFVCDLCSKVPFRSAFNFIFSPFICLFLLFVFFLFLSSG